MIGRTCRESQYCSTISINHIYLGIRIGRKVFPGYSMELRQAASISGISSISSRIDRPWKSQGRSNIVILDMDNWTHLGRERRRRRRRRRGFAGPHIPKGTLPYMWAHICPGRTSFRSMRHLTRGKRTRLRLDRMSGTASGKPRLAFGRLSVTSRLSGAPNPNMNRTQRRFKD